MNALMATAAAASVACSSGDSSTSGASPSASSDAKNPGSAATTDASGPRKIPTGYQVVDPIPRPSRCATSGGSAIKATSTITAKSDHAWDIVLHLTSSDPKVSVTGADYARHRTSSDFTKPLFAKASDGATVTTTVDPTKTDRLRLFLAVECEGEKGEASAEITLREPKAKTPTPAPTTLPVTVAPVGTVTGMSDPYGI